MPNMSGFFPTPQITGVQSLLTYDTTVTGGAFGWALLLLWAFIVFFALGAWPKHQALLAASFNAFLAALPLAALGLVPGFAISLTAVLFVASATFAYYVEHH